VVSKSDDAYNDFGEGVLWFRILTRVRFFRQFEHANLALCLEDRCTRSFSLLMCRCWSVSSLLSTGLTTWSATVVIVAARAPLAGALFGAADETVKLVGRFWSYMSEPLAAFEAHP
jgi:hypothetical protein